MSTRHAILLLLALVLPAGLAAFAAGPAPDDAAPGGHRRFRVEVWRLRPTSNGDVAPPSLESLGLTPTEAVRPVAMRPRAAGWVGAAVTSPELLAAIADLPGAKAVFRMETECGAGEEAFVQVSREFPLTRTEFRGDQRIQTTLFQREGAKLQLTPKDGDGSYSLDLEFSAVSAVVPEVGAQMFTARSTGSVSLADGTTSILAYTDRADAKIRQADADQVVQYLYLITRLDLEE